MSTQKPLLSDVNTIPRKDWGIVDLALQLNLLSSNAKNAFLPFASITQTSFSMAVNSQKNVSAHAIARMANAVANSVWIGFPYTENASQQVNIGTKIPQIAYQVQNGELVLPGSATLFASSGTIGPNGSYTAPNSPGIDTVTAEVVGTSVTQSMNFQVYDPQSLSFSKNMPAVMGMGVTSTLVGNVISPDPSNPSSFTVDPADAGCMLTLAVTDPFGNTVTIQATDQAGKASFQWTPTAVGDYTLILNSPGLPSVSSSIQVIAPVSGSSLAIQNTSISANQSTPVSLSLNPGTASTLPSVLPIYLQVSGSGSLKNVVSSVYTAAAEQPGGAVVGALVGGTTPGTATVTASSPGNVIQSVYTSANVQGLGTIQAIAPSQSGVAGSTVTVSAKLTLANGNPAPSGVTVSFTPITPDGEMGLLSTKCEVNSATATTNAQGVAVAQLPDQYMAGTYSLSVTANGYSSANTSYSMRPGRPVRLDAVVSPSPFVTAGKTVQVVAAAVDAYGNPIPTTTLPVNVTFQGKDGTFKQTATKITGRSSIGNFTAGSTVGSDQVTITSRLFPGQRVTLPIKVLTNPAQILEGKGTWATYGMYAALGAKGMISAMKKEGITHLYLETAVSGAGFYGQLPLDRIVNLAHQAGIAVINWTSPSLQNLQVDEANAQAAMAYQTRMGSSTDGYTGDFEENLSAQAMGSYSKFIRHLIGPNMPYIATIFPPQDQRGTPLGVLAKYVTAFAPMDYWHGLEQNYTFSQIYHYVRIPFISSARRRHTHRLRSL